MNALLLRHWARRRLCRALTTDAHLPDKHTISTPPKRLPSINDPRPTRPIPNQSVSLAHPLDPQTNRNPLKDDPSPSKDDSGSTEREPPQPDKQEPLPSSREVVPLSTVPTTTNGTLHHHPSSYSNPPFNTHSFFAVLEKTFPTPTARSLMRATRALLVDRMARVRREGLTIKDLDNQAYLFRAALQELRTEITTNAKSATTEARSALTALSKDVDALEVKMKEDIATLKHEIQMEVDSRKNESKSELKKHDILIEEVMSKAIVSISELRTEVEEIKWENMRRSVVALFSFAFAIIVFMELQPKPKPAPTTPPPRPADAKQPEAEGLERMDWVT